MLLLYLLCIIIGRHDNGARLIVGEGASATATNCVVGELGFSYFVDISVLLINDVEKDIVHCAVSHLAKTILGFSYKSKGNYNALNCVHTIQLVSVLNQIKSL